MSGASRRRPQASRGAGFALVTLGCAKNEADADRLRRLLAAAGHVETRPADADLVVVLTCGFIDAAKEESIDAVLDAATLVARTGGRLAVAGCLVERHREELARELPEVDVWCGLDPGPLVAALDGLAASRSGPPPRPWRRPRPVAAAVKVSDGCDRRCAYCAIPLIKGPYRALPARDVLAAAAAALKAGAREIVLVGQDTSRWAEPAPYWLRVLYLQPDGVDDRLLEAIARLAVPYLDVPFQHASGRVLRRMGRPGDGEAYLALLERVRAVLPDAAVRSAFITGFPGETEDDVEELLAFVAEARLAVAGVFAFDPQEGTAAATMPGQVPPAVALERAARVGEAIAAAAESWWVQLVGRTVDVLVERGCRRPDGVAVGRVAWQAPDVDGLTTLRGRRVRRGEVVRARVLATVGYDVEAVAVEPSP